MKCKAVFFLAVVVLLVLQPQPILLGEALIKIGPVDTEALEALKGFWMIEKSQFVFEFTTQYACMISGVKYFHYTRNRAHTDTPWVYTVIKSRKTGRYYFARGSYRNGRFFGSTSRILFDDMNNITIFSSKDPEKVYFKARRITQKNVAKSLKKKRM